MFIVLVGDFLFSRYATRLNRVPNQDNFDPDTNASESSLKRAGQENNVKPPRDSSLPTKQSIRWKVWRISDDDSEITFSSNHVCTINNDFAINKDVYRTDMQARLRGRK